jgi:DNA-directed RNA polymerase specialized sigma24 family protein
MASNGSISQWIATLRGGDLEPIQRLWDRFRNALIASAQRQLSTVPKLTVDQDDIAQSVLVAIWKGTEAGLFDKVTDRDELWWTLLKITRRKVVTAYRREKTKQRGRWGMAARERLQSDLDASGFHTFKEICNDEPTPESICTLQDETTRLLDLLPSSDLQQIAIDRIEGFTVEEIAHRLSLTPRSIERKLQLIRNRWSKELHRAEH